MARQKNTKSLEELCKRDTDLDLISKEGFTPMFYAFQALNLNALEILLQNKADPDKLDKYV